MTCKHCSEEICDTCWQKRADILYERDDLRTEVTKLRSKAEYWEQRARALGADDL